MPWSLSCVQYTHGGCKGHADSESAQHCLTREKLSQFVLVLLAGFEPRVFWSWVRCSTNWAIPSPQWWWWWWWWWLSIYNAPKNSMHSMLVAPQGDESFEACCQWALLHVQIITLLFQFTVHKYINLPSWQQSACLVFSCFRNPPNSDLRLLLLWEQVTNSVSTKNAVFCLKKKKKKKEKKGRQNHTSRNKDELGTKKTEVGTNRMNLASEAGRRKKVKTCVFCMVVAVECNRPTCPSG